MSPYRGDELALLTGRGLNGTLKSEVVKKAGSASNSSMFKP